MVKELFYNNCLIPRALIGSFSSSRRVPTDKILIYQLLNSSVFSCQIVNFLINENLLTFLGTNQKARKAIDNPCVILNKIHIALFTASLRRLSPTSVIPGIRRRWGLVVVKNKLTSVFYSSVLLLKINCVITLSNWFGTTSRRRVVPQ